ncbi:hypothetical protein CWO92_15700 [Heyndrickxia camelliae]|uniref:Uncharacterized protein n=1 Tax=Heyndrickxia camelliae TaxID=1707093 RepID=A0A2N3LI31_9BACI|nr:hypothetical protein CWO92_15700 [Heyndrickxia camelliae]
MISKIYVTSSYQLVRLLRFLFYYFIYFPFIQLKIKKFPKYILFIIFTIHTKVIIVIFLQSKEGGWNMVNDHEYIIRPERLAGDKRNSNG